MAFSYLIFGHLLGDFVLQTDIIAGNKGKHWEWNALHAFLVTLCIFAMGLSFGGLTLGLVLANGVVHFLMDFYKPKLVRYFRLSELTGFLADQLLHIILLYLVSLTALPGRAGFILQDAKTVKLLIVVLFLTSFAAVLNQFLLGGLFPRADSKFFKQGEKKAGILFRLFISAIIYLSIAFSPFFLLLLIPVISVLIIIYRCCWSAWMSRGQLFLKLALDLAVSMAGISLIFCI